jgi:nitroimidazol reductase NimA-like FMN-containing flavoprotein (pyridoxamine 5'-phosphate oxidase superfamily)
MDRFPLHELSPTECRLRLESAQIGRLVFTDCALPVVQPAYFLLDGGDIVIRSGGGPKLGAVAARGDVLAFEVDHIDPESRCGWSVLVVGHASLVDDLDETVAPGARSCRQRSTGRHALLIRIAGERITGQRLSLSLGPGLAVEQPIPEQP